MNNRPSHIRVIQFSVFCWSAMAFTLPFSSALTQLFAYLAVFSSLILFSKDGLTRVFREPLVQLTLGLWVLLSLSVFWSIAPLPELTEGWSKYRKLLFAIIFIFAVSRNPDCLWLPLKAFAASNGIIAFLACLVWLGVDQWRPPDSGIFFVGPASNPTIGRNHITQGAFQVMAASLSIGFALAARSVNVRVGWLSVGVLTLFTSLGLLQGRTGYLLAIVAAAALVLLLISVRRFKVAVLVGFAAFLLFSSIWQLSPNFGPRTIQAIQSIEKYSSGADPNADQGVRLQFYAAGLDIFLESPVLGNGVGSFAEAYSRLPNENADLQRSRAQPHSEYINLMVQGGSLALALFLAIGGLALKQAWGGVDDKAKSPKDFSLAILVTLFWVGSAVNSYIWDLAEGHLLIIILGTVASRSILSKQVAPS